MSEHEVTQRIAARKRLLDIAYFAARRHGPERVASMLWQTQPALAELLGEREIGAIAHITTSRFGC
jgi:hypothetical protein